MSLSIESRCIHLEDDDRAARYGAVSFPIYQTATFAHPALGQSTGYDYSRVQNPTRQQLEKTVAALESGKVGGAGLDVVEEENDLVYFNRVGAALPHRTMNILRSMPNVIVSPHNAFYTDVNVASMVRSGFEELTDFAAGRSNPCEVPL